MMLKCIRNIKGGLRHTEADGRGGKKEGAQIFLPSRICSPLRWGLGVPMTGATSHACLARVISTWNSLRGSKTV